MKYIKTYENLLKGKSESRILSELDGKSDNDKIETLIKINMFELLPRNEDGICVYDGDLNLMYISLFALPNDLTVNGNLDCSYNKLIDLPKNLTVKGDLDCSYNLITYLPDNLTVGMTLNCSENKLTNLPENLTVNGSLYCHYNYLSKLPENLTVNGNLICMSQKSNIILELPKSAKLTGNFDN